MQNETAQPISELHVTIDPEIKTRLDFPAHTLVKADPVSGYTIYRLNTPLAPGDGMDKYYAAQAEQAEGKQVFADQTIHCEDTGWLRVLDITLNGAFRCSRAAVRQMAEQGTGGSIVNIGSTAAVAGNGPVPYCTAKAAVIGMTRSMAVELAGRGIRVNAVNPGATETPIYAGLPQEVKDSVAADSLLKRLAHPDEVAGAVAFLAGDDGSYATGSVLTVNGGAYFA